MATIFIDYPITQLIHKKSQRRQVMHSRPNWITYPQYHTSQNSATCFKC